ncbi:MAG: hypothetical protein A3A33_04050 [Candidatus Yanofskybacteria bacterium RIFCSPLOWO2_01_FULL_49_25]|uniref:Uncharacterized protein n=1 Tax=Candidatus Yanofskybacteria bacterium RIFCSPLOWO2_01_FULL_49_25 TaxID=1802701 RepID=A0A1F8GRM9_9BACT|nr:MAG: hypothetical protein A3A33_04050 [Candidatus Yanofskybacteria bacterium RIFCSPLOWO2_01_FULL_49_25]
MSNEKSFLSKALGPFSRESRALKRDEREWMDTLRETRDLLTDVLHGIRDEVKELNLALLTITGLEAEYAAAVEQGDIPLINEKSRSIDDWKGCIGQLGIDVFRIPESTAQFYRTHFVKAQKILANAPDQFSFIVQQAPRHIPQKVQTFLDRVKQSHNFFEDKKLDDDADTATVVDSYGIPLDDALVKVLLELKDPKF